MVARSELADTPKLALSAFISELQENYYPWYESSVVTQYRIWLPLQIVALSSSIITTILAALMTDEAFKGLSAGRISLVVLPAIGTAASSIALQAKVYERYQLREKGRLAVQALQIEGERRYASAKGDAEYATIHADLEARLQAVEAAQGEGYFAIARV